MTMTLVGPMKWNSSAGLTKTVGKVPCQMVTTKCYVSVDLAETAGKVRCQN